MDSRRRGAAYLLAVLVAGRLLDALDLPFERRTPPGFPDSTRAAGDSAVAPVATARVDSGPRGSLPPSSLSLNRAGVAELQTLPGVGPVLARRLVEYRQAHGALRSLADLRRVKGFGPRTCERLAPHVRFD